MERIEIARMRRALDGSASAVALCGAGISMPGPTCMPSGNELRDIVVTSALRDARNARIVDALLRSPAYRALLPEAVIQLLGHHVQPYVDRFISRFMREVPPNPLHLTLARRFPEIFTTNFDHCLERAGAVEVHHLHGSVARPETLQHRLWRLGRTAGPELARFSERISGRWLFVTGYSLRDADVVEALRETPDLRLLYLSHAGDLPPALETLRGEILYSVGPITEVLEVEDGRRIADPPAIPRIRQPPRPHKTVGLMFLLTTCELVDEVGELYSLERHHLRGFERLRAAALMADMLRGRQRFEEAREIASSVLTSRARAFPDLESWLLTLLGLCEHESGGDPRKARNLYLKALRAMTDYGRRNTASPGPERVAMWKAKIANNLGNVERDLGHFRRAEILYGHSIRVKEDFKEESAAALTRINRAVLQVRDGRWEEAIASVDAAIPAIEKSPEPYICHTAMFDLAVALAEALRLPVSTIEFGRVDVEGFAAMARDAGAPPERFGFLVERLRTLDRIKASILP